VHAQYSREHAKDARGRAIRSGIRRKIRSGRAINVTEFASIGAFRPSDWRLKIEIPEVRYGHAFPRRRGLRR
jgi:hypothetical protein